MATSNSNDDGVWPGFVDALTNVVFVMIIVVMVLMLMFMATLLKVVKVERERAAAEITAQEVKKLNAELVTAAAKSPQPPLERVELVRAPAPPTTTPVVRVLPANKVQLVDTDVMADAGILFLAFEGQDSDLDDKAKADMQRLLANVLPELRRSGVSLRADAVPPFVSDGRRLAYYRVVRIREWLVEQGVPGTAIDMRIADRPSVEGKKGVLFMRRAPGDRAAAAPGNP